MDFSTLSTGKLVRMVRMAFEHGPGDGKLLILPIDQGFEHGPVDFMTNPESKDPRYQFQLALNGDYSAIAVHIGLAQRYLSEFAGLVPLVLKLNGKTNIPSDDNAFSPLTSSVEDAVRIGADAVGYTLYVGSPRQDDDIAQLSYVRAECDKLGIPLIVWSYPRGKAIENKGGKNSLYAVDYASRLALELGADVIKLNYPSLESNNQPDAYKNINEDEIAMMKRIVESAGKAGVIVSGGSKITDEKLLLKVKNSISAGVMGFIFGRNMWQRPMKEALELTDKIQSVMTE